ncbi:hypothetical protein Tsubulata_011481 [Turnera subulata]|uniref:rRNA N-glycosylase n=1 Tax=Turnera subulata TaxID=218843 RepID=A0A9Q0GHN6_9ROSI|nr:hypothetical protein Tsubulata_011481 [Turnera subulata]
MKLCKVEAVLAIWVCLILVVEAALKVDVEISMDEGTTYETYNEDLILPIRNSLKSGYINTIPNMSEKEVVGTARYGVFRIQIQEALVSVVIDINNLYVVGFHSNNAKAKPPNAYYYLKENNGKEVIPDGYKDAVGLFQGATALPLGYEGSYIAMGNRASVALGRQPLINAITTLYYRKEAINDWKKRFLVIIQMVSEAVRSGFVGNGVMERFEDWENSAPDEDIVEVENSWVKSSKAVTGAKTYAGDLVEPIVLPSGTVIKTINDVKKVGLVSLLNPSYLPTSRRGTLQSATSTRPDTLQSFSYKRKQKEISSTYTTKGLQEGPLQDNTLSARIINAARSFTKACSKVWKKSCFAQAWFKQGPQEIKQAKLEEKTIHLITLEE